MTRAFFVVALVAQHALAQTPSAPDVRVRGSVYDSLTRAPLAAATVRFARVSDPGAGSVSATTDAEGRFELTLPPGAWLAGIEHARFDSLGVTMPVRRIDVPPGSAPRISLATASARTLTGAFCGEVHDSDAVIVGMVHAAGSDAGLDSADVLAQWTNLSFARGGVVRSVPTQSARTDRNGWYVLCGVPQRAEIIAWAERGGSATGLIPSRTGIGPSRFDLWLDPSAAKMAAVPDTGDSRAMLDGERRRPAARSGSIRFAGLVRSESGQPVQGVRARILGHRFGFGDEKGAFALDSLPSGSQTLEVRALGFVPVTRVVNLATGGAAPEVIALTSVKSLLDTVRVTAGRVYNADATGFESRRKNGIGQYITRAEVERWHPASFTSLLQARSGVMVTDAGGTDRTISMLGMFGTCTPVIWVDGDLEVRPPKTNAGAVLTPLPGAGQLPTDLSRMANKAASDATKEIDARVLPTEIEGVEIYRSAVSVPAQFQVGGSNACGAIVIWTRFQFSLPKPTPP